eukprot:PhF_6_TR12602/c1_g1_i5/m.19875
MGRKWFVYLDAVYTIALSSACAFNTTTEKMCFRNSCFVLLTVFLYNCFSMYFQPYHTRRDFIITAICGMVDFMAASFAFGSYVTGSDTVIVTKLGGYMCVLCMMMISFILLLIDVAQRCVNMYSYIAKKKWKKNKNKKIEVKKNKKKALSKGMITLNSPLLLTTGPSRGDDIELVEIKARNHVMGDGIPAVLRRSNTLPPTTHFEL